VDGAPQQISRVGYAETSDLPRGITPRLTARRG